ncbi:MAG: hypothetical protein N3D85_02095 [Candidatus Bathyarchaeota archaeon]|nr:hypothetical protein [Candidatus Bathyarchaeota archaeon]
MVNNRDEEKFVHDLNVLLTRLTTDMSNNAAHKLKSLHETLLQLHKENVVKINHSVMELVCAKYLILKEYTVRLEQKLSDILTCDLLAIKGYGNLIVEIETGYIPPEHAMDPLTYTYARLASKIIRYSCFSGKFAIGVPPHYILPLPRVLTLPPKKRTPQGIEEIKNLCDWYYQNPPVTEEEIKNARIHEIYVIDVDRTTVQAMDPTTYMKRALHKGVIFTLKEEPITKQAKRRRYLTKGIEKLDRYLI